MDCQLEQVTEVSRTFNLLHWSRIHEPRGHIVYKRKQKHPSQLKIGKEKLALIIPTRTHYTNSHSLYHHALIIPTRTQYTNCTLYNCELACENETITFHCSTHVVEIMEL